MPLPMFQATIMETLFCNNHQMTCIYRVAVTALCRLQLVVLRVAEILVN